MTLQQYITKTKLKQSVVARQIGISPATMCRLLNGTRSASPALKFMIKAKTGDKVTKWN